MENQTKDYNIFSIERFEFYCDFLTYTNQCARMHKRNRPTDHRRFFLVEVLIFKHVIILNSFKNYSYGRLLLISLYALSERLDIDFNKILKQLYLPSFTCCTELYVTLVV